MKKFKIIIAILSCVLAFATVGPSLAGASNNNESNESYTSLSTINEYPTCSAITNESAAALIDPNFTGPVGTETVNGILYSKYHISATQASKIGKALAAGAGAATLASQFGLPLVVASVLVFLYGANELCNWNNKGYTIYYVTIINLSFCIPD